MKNLPDICRLRCIAFALACISMFSISTPAALALEQANSAQGSSPQTQEAAIDAAQKALTEMGESLASQQKLAYDIDMVTDVVVDTDKKVQVKGTAVVRFERPNRLYVDLKTDTMERQFYHDGNHLTMIAKKDGYYGQLPATKSTRETLITAAKNYGLEVPLVDLLEWGTTKAPKINLEKAVLVKETTMDGKPVEHWALRSGNLDWEVWITKGDERLPLKLTTTDYQHPGKPQMVAEIKWRSPSDVNSGIFKPRLTSDLKPIDFNKIDPAPEVSQ